MFSKVTYASIDSYFFFYVAVQFFKAPPLIAALNMTPIEDDKSPSSLKVFRQFVTKFAYRCALDSMKNTDKIHDANVIFSAPKAIASLCRLTMSGNTLIGCTMNCKRQLAQCRTGVVCLFPFTRGKVYAVQTGRCMNDNMVRNALLGV